MNHRMVNLIIVALALLGMSSICFWVRSYFPEQMHWCGHDGKLLLLFMDTPTLRVLDPTSEVSEELLTILQIFHNQQYVTTEWKLVGVEFVSGNFGPVQPYALLAIPFAYITLLFVTPLISLSIWSHRRRQRDRHGLCGNCGYDLRASIERCPECGTPIPANAPRGRG